MSGVPPVPLRLTVTVGFSESLDEMLKLELKVPPEVGANRTMTVQLDPEARTWPSAQVPPDRLKGLRVARSSQG